MFCVNTGSDFVHNSRNESLTRSCSWPCVASGKHIGACHTYRVDLGVLQLVDDVISIVCVVVTNLKCSLRCLVMNGLENLEFAVIELEIGFFVNHRRWYCFIVSVLCLFDHEFAFHLACIYWEFSMIVIQGNEVIVVWVDRADVRVGQTGRRICCKKQEIVLEWCVVFVKGR